MNESQIEQMQTTDAQKKYEEGFLCDLNECKTMAEVRELISETYAPDDIFGDYDLQQWAIRYADNHSDY
jgi:hypothetical protein